MFNPSENLIASHDADASRTTPEFSPEQRKFLLTIAHEAIASKIAGKPLPGTPPSSAPARVWAPLQEPRGVFTTLYLHGDLRGCVGYAAPIRSLLQAVAETACAAAFDDSRFQPVSAAELPELKISLSVLSQLFPIDAPRVEVGRHGLVISDGMRRGLLLPQVPAEHGWEREAFLEQTCRKAGLPMDAWRHSAKIEAFTAEVFSDDEPGDDEPGRDGLSGRQS
ncbi:MAG: AmmeMemoRadiSam system protein A [Terriglobales bacterium]|jgi:AmmeMemoRadiSam system protein A